VGMTSVFFSGDKEKSSVTTLVNINAGDLTFRDGADGLHETSGDIALIAFGDNGDIAGRTTVTFHARLNEPQYKHALSNGFLHIFQSPVKKPGPYDVRVAVRDKASGKVGTAGAFLEVPELKKERMVLSGILLQTAMPAGQTADPGQDLRGGTALRIFHAGETVTYGYQVLNPKLDKATKRPNVEARVRLYRDGKEFFAGKPALVEVTPGAQRVLAGGNLKIGPDLPPGEYVLEVAANDLLAEAKNGTATQYIDFRVVP